MRLLGSAALAASVLTIALVQSRAAATCAAAKEHDDVYLLPPPDELRAMALGYRSSVADVMWADVLVTQGFRLQERRHYDTLVPLLDGITALDPQFREPYLFADALITFQSVPSTPEDARAARRIMELGTRNRPLDAELWLNLGTFVCFLAPSSILTDPDEELAWREQGALYLERAVELSGDNSNVAWQALGGGVRFESMGERDAAIRFYRKVLEATDDDELRARAQAKLDAALAETAAVGDREGREARDLRASEEKKRLAALQALKPELRERRREHYAGLSWEAMMIAGPANDPYLCAGLQAGRDTCATTWKVWADERVRALSLGIAPP